jgi:CRP-like cAMP-binding protein
MRTVTQDESGPLANRLIASLSRSDFNRLSPALSTVSLGQGTLLYDVGDEVEHAYFPQTGMVSLLSVMDDGKAIETATVGREGVVGAMAGLDFHTALDRAVVQLPLTALKIRAAAFRKAVQASTPLRDLVIASNQALLAQAQATAACNALHAVEQRLCRWILHARDRNNGDVVRLTQEFLSEMLGVRRSSVGDVARKLQDARLIRYSRGTITIVDRKALEAASCECYRAILRRTSRIFGGVEKRRR